MPGCSVTVPPTVHVWGEDSVPLQLDGSDAFVEWFCTVGAGDNVVQPPAGL